MILRGVRVVEMAVWVAGPAAAGLMADWGADVIKLEPLRGDPMRAVFGASAGMHEAPAPPFNLDNRGKRSIAVDLARSEGRELARRLIASADVFVTNVRLGALERLGLDYESLRSDHPRLIYALATGYGTDGPERERAAYDVGAFWARTGIAQMLSREQGDPSPCRPGLGDHVTGLSLLAGIAGALYERERSGRGQLVQTSLLRTGIYSVGWDLGTFLELGWVTKTMAREKYVVPLVNNYRAGDGRWFWLLGLEAERHWPKLLRAIERTDLADDPRFATAAARHDNCRALIAVLDEVFAGAPLEVWGRRLDAEDLWWSPVQTPEQVVADPQARASGAFVDYPLPGDAGTAKSVAGPIDFERGDTGPKGPPPQLGEHTDRVLAEIGLAPSEIVALREAGVIG